MTRGRASLSLDLTIAGIAAATTWAALTTWASFVEDRSSFLVPAAALGAVVALGGVAVRALPVPRVLAPVAQLALVTIVLSVQITGSWIPLGAGMDQLVAALEAATQSARTYAAPVGPDVAPITPLLLIGAAGLFLLVDVAACTTRTVPVAGLPLLAVFSVPAGLTGTSPHWSAFVASALGFLVLLHLDTSTRLLRWGRAPETRSATPARERPDDRAPSGTSTAATVGRGGALTIATFAIGLALVAPMVVPVLDAEVIGFGGDGGSGEIKIRKPRADLRRDLERGDDVPLIRVSTDDPSPSYLRIGVLNRFTGDEWSSGDRDVSSDQTADRDIPVPQGLSPDVPTRSFDYAVEVEEAFDSTWLPTQYPLSSISAPGDWRYDEDTYDFIGVDDENASGTAYEMTALVPDFGTSGRWFGDPASSAVEAEVLEVPGGLPSIARSAAVEVTEGALNDYERARMLQSWFRSEGGFRYSLERAPEGSVGDTLQTFLTDGPGGRVGYCEQFAAAMAIMARIVGIPARVAVGFLRPASVGDGTWEYSSHDLHAWPELYFSGTGWVRFEPTPGGRARTAPDYSTVPVRDGSSDDPGGAPGQQPSTGQRPDQRPSQAAPTAPAEDEAGAQSGGDGSGRSPVTIVLLVAVLLVMLAVAVAGPRAVRRARRARRLDGTQEDLWREVLDTADDLGVSLPRDRSPRETATRLEAHLAEAGAEDLARPRAGGAAAPHAAEALEALVSVVERGRYGRPETPGGLATRTPAPRLSAVAVVDALEAGATRSARRGAAWWPRSLWRRA